MILCEEQRCRAVPPPAADPRNPPCRSYSPRLRLGVLTNPRTAMPTLESAGLRGNAEDPVNVDRDRLAARGEYFTPETPRGRLPQPDRTFRNVCVPRFENIS